MNRAASIGLRVDRIRRASRFPPELTIEGTPDRRAVSPVRNVAYQWYGARPDVGNIRAAGAGIRSAVADVRIETPRQWATAEL